MTYSEILTHFRVDHISGKSAMVHSPCRDDPGASVVITDAGNRVLMHDFGQNSTKENLEAVGLRMSDLYRDGGNGGNDERWKTYVEKCVTKREGRAEKIEAVYHYLSIDDGAYAYTKIRLNPKTFVYGTLSGGRFTFGLGGRQRKNIAAVYGDVHAVRGAIDRGGFTCYAEGEKDVDTLSKLGFAAVTCGGAGDWSGACRRLFKGANVVIFRDNDQAGLNLASQICGDLIGIAKSIRIVNPVPKIAKGDVSDFIANGGTLDDVMLMIEAEEPVGDAPMPGGDVSGTGSGEPFKVISGGKAKEPPPVATLPQNPESDRILKKLMELDAYRRYPMNDRGNAMMFADVFGGECRYCADAKSYYHYSGIKWSRDTESMRARGNAKKLADGLTRYAAAAEIGGDERAAYLKHVIKLNDYRSREVMVNDARDLTFIDRAELDADDYILNVQNCVLDLSGDAARVLEHSPDMLLSKVADVEYDPTADCPLWLETLNQIFEGDAEKIAFLQRILGLSLTGYTGEQKLFMLYGQSTRNGKSTICNVIGALMGDYAATVNPESLAVRKFQDSRSPSPDIAKLNGVRFVVANEPEKKMLLNSSLIKNLTGDDKVSARFLGENEVSFWPRFKMFLNTNHKPLISDMTIFESGRMQVLTFDRHFGEAERNKNLKAELLKEKSGILNWAVSGWFNYKREGLNPPQAVKDAVAAYAQDSDKVGRFINEALAKTPGRNTKVKDVYERYAQWCGDSGYGAEGKQNFISELKSRGMFAQSGTVNGVTVPNVIRGYSIAEERFTAADIESTPFSGG